jgi:PAS domain S-box-containing protein
MLTPPGILIVEDDSATAAALVLQLNALGYPLVGVASNSEQAILAIARELPAVALVDLDLRGTPDGLAIASRLRAAASVPVVFLSGAADAHARLRQRGEGAAGCLSTTPRLEELEAAIAVALHSEVAVPHEVSGEERLTAILDGIADAVVAIDAAERVVFLNANAVRLAGRSDAVALGGPISALFTVIDARDESGRTLGFDWRCGSERLGRENAVYLTLRRYDGGERHVRAAVSPLGLGGAVTMLHDLTQRRQAEVELQRMGRALRVLSESSRALQRASEESALLNDVCRIVVEEGGYRLAWVGVAEQDSARTILPVAQAGYRDRYLEQVKMSWAEDDADCGPTGEAIRTGEVVVARDILADERYSDWRLEAAKRGFASGIALPLQHGGTSIGALTIYAVEAEAFDKQEMELLRELSHHLSYGVQALRTRVERQRAERDLLKAEARYRTLVEQIPIITYIAAIDEHNSMLYLSPQITALTGFTPERWISNPAFFVNRLYPADRVRVLSERVRCGGESQPIRLEYRLLSSDGRMVWVSDEARVVPDEAGRPQFIHGVITDISSRKLAESSLTQALETLRALVTASPLAIYMIDGRGLVTTVWNLAAERIFGWKAEEVLGRRLPTVGDGQREEFEHLRERVMAGETLTGVEVLRQRRDGTPIHLSLALAPLRGADGTVESVVAMVADVTERRRAEAALASAQRDATVGRMAAVVAHEVNNPLAAIKAWLGLLHADLAHLPEVCRHLELIGHQVDRIARTVRNLLGFARQREAREERVSASLLIRTVAELFVGRMRAKGIAFEIDVAEQLPAIGGDVDQLQEVFINLLENACQALEAGRHVKVMAAAQDGIIEITVDDDGPGLGSDIDKLFTPFYTTKVNGTGLGLIVARRITEAHGGHLVAENLPNLGARFRVRLPILGADGETGP